MFKAAWSRYCSLLVEKPLITKGLTGGFLFGTGDVLGQYLDGTIEKGSFDIKRTMKGFMWSACIFTPIAHVWYSRVLPRYYPNSDFASALKKMVIDQGVFAPLINLLFLSYVVTPNISLENIKNKIKTEYLDVMKTNYMVWPLTQLIMFKLIPVSLQLPFMNVVVLFWSAYMSVVGNRKLEETAIDFASTPQVQSLSSTQ